MANAKNTQTPVKQAIDTEQALAQERRTRLELDLNYAEKNRRELVKRYKAEELVKVHVSPLYASALGKVMQVSINGIVIWFPINGKTYSVPKTFAAEINARVRYQDILAEKQSRLADVKSNLEMSPGELQLI